ncbi:MAG: hypothetical protein PVH77_05595, partial [Phycisphaerales bacterium]
MSQDPNSTIEFIKEVPEFVWPVIIAIIGLLGVIIGTFLSWFPVYFQLRHDSKQRRLSNLRDIYISAAEKLGQQLDFLANFYCIDKPRPEGWIEALHKVSIVGTFDTIKAVNKFNDYINETVIEFNPSREKMIFLQGLHESRARFINETQQRINKYLQEMEEYNKIGIRDDRKWAIIQDNYNFAQKSVSDLLNSNLETLNEINKLTYELEVKCLNKCTLAEELAASIIVAIKEELNIQFNIKEYRTMMYESYRNFEKKL